MKTRRGQSIAEYAVLIGLVLGAVLAMQNYIRVRIAGAIKNKADAYATSSGAGNGFTVNRSSDSLSNTNLGMTTATTGTVNAISNGTSVTTVQ